MRFNTRLVHDGKNPEDAVNCPIFQTSNFSFPSIKEAEDRFSFKSMGYVYTRGRNPTTNLLEKKIAFLEEGEKSLVFSSGMAAISTLAFSVLGKNSHAVCSDVVYRSTWELFDEVLPKYGVETSFVDSSNAKNVEEALNEKTKLVFLETPTNPTMKLSNIREISSVTKENNVLLCVDNTFMTPVFQKPLVLGADFVVESLTKFMNGHSDALGGSLTCSEKRFWSVWEDYCIMGGVIDPFSAWLVNRGLKTLGVRMKQHEKNAFAVAEFLEDHPKVLSVNYPGLKSFSQHELAKKQMKGFGGVLSFRVKGGEQKAREIANKVKVITLGVSLGGVESLIEHSTSMVHSSMSREAQENIGITPDLLRLSVGIEDEEDLKKDLSQALD